MGYQGRRSDHPVVPALTPCWFDTLTHLQAEEAPHSMRQSRGVGPPPRREESRGTPGDMTLVCLGSVAQLHSGGLQVRELQSTGATWGSSLLHDLSYLWLAEVGCHFAEHARQAGF